MNKPCTNCGTTDPRGPWWNLENYFKISGRFCPKCYDQVSHDAYGNPRNPNAYLLVLLKQSSVA